MPSWPPTTPTCRHRRRHSRRALLTRPAGSTKSLVRRRPGGPTATTAVALAAAGPEPATTPAGPTLINVIGTIFFGLFDMFTNVIAGPPAVPPNSNVRVGRSTLQIDCGDGYTADADCDVPTSQEPPKALIYLQHGILANASYYDVTAAALAEWTNSIVVAPTITSNIFACDSCFLVGDPMHFAIAKLFSGDRAALNASLDAAFEGEDFALPQKMASSTTPVAAELAAASPATHRNSPGRTGRPTWPACFCSIPTTSVDSCRAASRRCR